MCVGQLGNVFHMQRARIMHHMCVQATRNNASPPHPKEDNGAYARCGEQVPRLHASLLQVLPQLGHKTIIDTHLNVSTAPSLSL